MIMIFFMRRRSVHTHKPLVLDFRLWISSVCSSCRLEQLITLFHTRPFPYAPTDSHLHAVHVRHLRPKIATYTILGYLHVLFTEYGSSDVISRTMPGAVESMSITSDFLRVFTSRAWMCCSNTGEMYFLKTWQPP